MGNARKGEWLYHHMLDVIKNPNHPEHDELLEWCGGEHEPEKFDIQEVNRAFTVDGIPQGPKSDKRMNLSTPLFRQNHCQATLHFQSTAAVEISAGILIEMPLPGEYSESDSRRKYAEIPNKQK